MPISERELKRAMSAGAAQPLKAPAGPRPCPSCGYDRAGIPAEQRCPECGATGSIEGGRYIPDPTALASPHDLAAIRIAGVLTAGVMAAIPITMIFRLAIGRMLGTGVLDAVAAGCVAAVSGVWIYAAFLLTKPRARANAEPTTTGGLGWLSLGYRLLAVCFAAGMAAGFIDAAFAAGSARRGQGRFDAVLVQLVDQLWLPFYIAGVATWVLGCVASARIADWLNDPDTAHQLRLLAIPGIGLALLAPPAVLGWAGPIGPITMTGLCLLDAVVLAILLVILNRLRSFGTACVWAAANRRALEERDANYSKRVQQRFADRQAAKAPRTK